MRQLHRMDWVLVTLTAIILLLVASGAAVASQSELEITLAPGAWRFVEFTNTGNEPENLKIENTAAPSSLIPCLFVSPRTIPANSSCEVAFHFVQTQSIRENIPPDMYALRVSGGDNDLLVYLDLSIPLPEDAESCWAEIEDNIDALEASLMKQIDRIKALESAPELKNWMPWIENLRENVRLEISGIRAEFAALATSIPGNSSSINLEWLTKLLDNRETGLRKTIGNDIANLEIDKRLAEAKSENERLRYEVYAALAVAIIAAVIAIRGVKMKKPRLTTPKKLDMTEIPLGDRIVMMENEISAMKERGDPEDSIKEKERELWELRGKLKPKKRGKK